MRWNKRTTDCFGTLRAGQPTLLPLQRIISDTGCFPVRIADCSSRLSLRTPAIDATLVRDLVLGPKVLAELAILRRLART